MSTKREREREPLGILECAIHKGVSDVHVYVPGTLIENDTRLYDLANNPGLNMPINGPDVETRMIKLIRDLMAKNVAPAEAFTRLGLS